MTDDLCPHDGDPFSCPPCLRARRPDLVETPAPTVERSFVARFTGDCPGCNLPITVGQFCDRWTDGRTRHLGCLP